MALSDFLTQLSIVQFILIIVLFLIVIPFYVFIVSKAASAGMIAGIMAFLKYNNPARPTTKEQNDGQERSEEE